MGKNIDYFDEHRMLMSHALMQGLTYRKYREALRLHDVTLEQAIEDSKRGITLNERLKLRTRIERNKRYVVNSFGGSAAVACIALISSVIYIHNNPIANVCKQYSELKRNLGMKEQVPQDGERYCLEAQNLDPNGNVYKTFVEASRPIVFGRSLFGINSCLTNSEHDCLEEELQIF